MKPALSATVILLCVTAFLAPVCGGSLNLEASTLEPGILPVIASILNGTDTPGAANLLIVLGAFACAFLLVARRRVIQLPTGPVSVALLFFAGLITISVAVSSYKSVSLGAWSQWMAYCIVFFAAASGAGRVKGPSIVLGAFVAGCAVKAALGIHEWGLMRATDPSWRIFGGWNNPNAFAGILVLGLILSLTLCATTERLASLLSGLAGIVIGLALFLTQSRGGILAAMIGVLILLIGVALQADKARRKDIGKPIACLVLSALCVGAILAGNRSELGKRLGSGTAATEQSTGFRKLLWKGAAKTIVAHPVGTGLGTYNFVSAESGLTAETKLAHNTFLQLGVEGSVFAPLALLGVFVLWGISVLRGKQPRPQSSILRIGIVAAVVASLVDGMFESNLYYFGTGVAVFLLLGLGLQAATDSVAPEFSPPTLRRSFGVGIIAITIFLGVFAFREIVKAHVRFDRQSGDGEAYTSDLSTLRSIADGDGEAHYLLGFLPTASPTDRIQQFKEAADLEPSVRHLKILGEANEQAGNPAAAEAAFRDALTFDPNNLETLQRLLNFYQKNDHPEEAIRTAKRMVDVDAKPYSTVRALSEIIPLETADARVFLASQTSNRTEATKDLGDATEIFVKYARTTVPYLLKIWNGVATSLPIANETQPGTVDKLQRGIEVAKSAAVAYRADGRPDEAAKAVASKEELERVLVEVTGAFGGNK